MSFTKMRHVFDWDSAEPMGTPIYNQLVAEYASVRIAVEPYTAAYIAAVNSTLDSLVAARCYAYPLRYVLGVDPADSVQQSLDRRG